MSCLNEALQARELVASSRSSDYKVSRASDNLQTLCPSAGCQPLPCSHQCCVTGTEQGAVPQWTMCLRGPCFAHKDSPELWVSPGHSLPPPLSNTHLGCGKQVIPERCPLSIGAAAGCGHWVAWQGPLLPHWWGQALVLRAGVSHNLASGHQLPFGWTAAATEPAAPPWLLLQGAQVPGLGAECCLWSWGLLAPSGHHWPFLFSTSPAAVSQTAPWLPSLPTRVQLGSLCNIVQIKVK